MSAQSYPEDRVTAFVRHRLQALRKHNKTHTSELSELLGLKGKQYYKYEDGTSKVPFYRLLILADFFDVSVDQFIPPALEVAPIVGRRFSEEAAPSLHPSDLDPALMADQLTEAFLSINDPAVRQSVIDMVNSIARSKPT